MTTAPPDRRHHHELLRALDDPRAMVEGALGIAVDLANAQRGWIGLFDADQPTTARPRSSPIGPGMLTSRSIASSRLTSRPSTEALPGRH